MLIADFGCGTGILGVELAKVGYTNIIGIDASEKMLEVCSQKKHEGRNVY